MMEETSNKVQNGRWLFLISSLFAVYLLEFLDGMIISYAAVGGMNEDFGLTASLTGLVIGIFSIGRMFLQIKAGGWASKGMARKIGAFLVLGNSIFLFMQGFADNGTQLLIYRFIQGIFQGGLYPMIIVIIGNWFPDKERSKAYTIFGACTATSQIIIGPLMGLILSTMNWRAAFIIFGIASLTTVILWLLYVTDFPQDAKWLKKEEKEYLLSELQREKELLSESAIITANANKLDKKPFMRIISNKYVWVLCGMNFCASIGVMGFGAWMPKLIADITGAGIGNVGLLATIPNIFVLFGLFMFSKLAGKSPNRRLLVGIPMLFFGSFLIIGHFASGVWANFILICIAAFFLQGYLATLWTIPPMIFAKDISGSVQGFIVMAGTFGFFVGPYLVGIIMDIMGNSSLGMVAVGICLIIGFVISRLLPIETTKPINNKELAA
ncbi:MFS transporter [Peribacillus butanolivorans]|nr:MFS transporter [Peribacillus butanolivorans]